MARIQILTFLTGVSILSGIATSVANEKPKTDLSNLPPNVAEEIGKYLTHKDISSVTKASKGMKKTSEHMHKGAFKTQELTFEFKKEEKRKEGEFEKLKSALEMASKNKTENTKPFIKLKIKWLFPENLEDFIGFIKKNQAFIIVTSLELDSSSIGDKGAKALAEILKENDSLTSLKLDANNVGAKGAKALAEILKKNKTLKNLWLNFNLNIEEEGAKEIALALKENEALTDLWLRASAIRDEGAKEIALALKTNKTLTYLDLAGNEISDEGARVLVEALKVNKTLTYLDLSENDDIGDETSKILRELVQEKRKTMPTFNIKLYRLRSPF